MKKLLVLALVLTVVSIAPASQIWTITGSTADQTDAAGWEVNAGDVLTMTLTHDSKTAGGVNIDVITDNGAAGIITAVSVNALFSNGDAGMSVAALDSMLIDMGASASGLATDDWAWVGAASGGDVLAVGQTIMTVSYTVGVDSGLVIINGLANAGSIGWEQNLNQIALTGGNEALGSVSLNVVPEPVTVALLGLGGLFIRRRK